MALWWKKKEEQVSAKVEADTSKSELQAPDKGPPSDSDPSTDSPQPSGKVSWFRRALFKTNQVLRTDIRDLWKSEGRLVDEEFVRELFAVLIRSDMGNAVATQIRERIQTDYRGRKVEMLEMLKVIREEIRQSLQTKSVALNWAASGPTVILVVGVNGSGKTTSIAKLAYRFTQQGKTVLLGAGDTFRAAAVEQLRVWSERIGCEIVLGEQGGDPASVAYKATGRARDEGFDVCILDTAGRLQTQTNLMQQLEKVRRVISKQIDNAPHEVLLVLDATAGQNAISQARGFSEVAGCTGIVLAKLDGSAKGGAIIPVLKQFGLPVKLVGIGEQLPDLAEFDPDSFSEALFDLNG